MRIGSGFQGYPKGVGWIPTSALGRVAEGGDHQVAGELYQHAWLGLGVELGVGVGVMGLGR